MAIIKRHHQKNGKKKFFYQAQVYIRGVRLTYKSFNTKAEAVIWHEKQRKKLIQNPSELFQTDTSEMFFSDCFNKYLEEAFPLLKKSTRQAYETRFRYFTERPLPHIKMKEFKVPVVYNWIN